MNNTNETQKNELFATVISLYKRYNKETNKELETMYWCEYKGFYKAITMMGLETELHIYSKNNDVELMIP